MITLQYKPIALIKLFLLHAVKPSNVFLLGAGASPAPVMSDFKQSVINEIKNFGFYDGSGHSDTTLRKSIGISSDNIESNRLTDDGLWNLTLTRHTKEEAIKQIFCEQLYCVVEKVRTGTRIPQYEFFKLIPPQYATIINFNNDSVIWNYGAHLQIIEPHGSIAHYPGFRIPIHNALIMKKHIEEWKDIVVDYGIRSPHFPSMVLPGEPEKVEFSYERNACLQALKMADTLFIIGYSFSEYDERIIENILNALSDNQNCTIFVFDLYRANEIRDNLGYYLRNDIYPCPFDWYRLSLAILEIVQNRPLSFIIDKEKEILDKYIQSLIS
jgi:hypothetical protein